MVARNDVTGDSIQSKAPSEAYRNNYDLIFKKKVDVKEETLTDTPKDKEEA